MPIPSRLTRHAGRPPATGAPAAPAAPGLRFVVGLAVAVVLAGYTLALGFTGVPVFVAALGGLVAGVVLVGALTD